MTTFPTPQPDQGATSPPDLDPSATASGNDGSGELRAEAGDFADDATLVALAAVIDPDAMAISGNLPIAEAMGWMARQDRALLDAHAIHEAGYRLVSEDDATVTAVGQAIMHALARVAGEDYDSPKAAWSEVGRAAVRALREGQA